LIGPQSPASLVTSVKVPLPLFFSKERRILCVIQGRADDDEVHVAIVVEISLDAVDAAELPRRDPALTLTSSKVPSPLLRKNAIGVVASLAVDDDVEKAVVVEIFL